MAKIALLEKSQSGKEFQKKPRFPPGFSTQILSKISVTWQVYVYPGRISRPS